MRFHGIVQAARDLKSIRSLEFFALHVKVLAITGSYSPDEVLVVLKACRNVKTMAYWGSLRGAKDDEIQSFLTSGFSPRRTYVTSNLFSQDCVHFSYPVFRNATHVELVWQEVGEASYPADDVKWDTLQDLKHLTHLSIFVPSARMKDCARSVAEIISNCPQSLQVFVLWVCHTHYFRNGFVDFEGIRAISEGEVDVRAVVAYMGSSFALRLDSQKAQPIIRSYQDIVNDCAGITVGKDFWALAEEKVAERLRQKSVEENKATHRRIANTS
ncbi:hypothetical protein MD484_g6220, partial [Candolleomyces efflorescens]